MQLETETPKELSKEEQEAASFLRERFLYLIASLPAKPSKISMYDKIKVTAQIRTFDLMFENVVVENLKQDNLPGVVPKSIVRTSDILSISYKDIQ